jgi:hypothetical protein
LLGNEKQFITEAQWRSETCSLNERFRILIRALLLPQAAITNLDHLATVDLSQENADNLFKALNYSNNMIRTEGSLYTPRQHSTFIYKQKLLNAEVTSSSSVHI